MTRQERATSTVVVGVFVNDSKYGKLHGPLNKLLPGREEQEDEAENMTRHLEDMTFRRVTSVAEAMECDVVLHKVLDLNISLSKEQEAALSMHPGLLDPLEPVRLLSDRRQTLQVVGDFLASTNPLFAIPPTILHPGKEMASWTGPSIAKPVSACSDPHSHTLLLLPDPTFVHVCNHQPIDNDDCTFADKDYIVQQFLPHGDCLLKAYVIGAHVDLVWKRSLREEDFDASMVLSFDSQSLKTGERSIGSLSPALPPQMELSIRTMLSALQAHLGLRLFGVDLLIVDDLHAYIVDVNYFPGYSGVADLGRKLRAAVRDHYR